MNQNFTNLHLGSTQIDGDHPSHHIQDKDRRTVCIEIINSRKWCSGLVFWTSSL